VGYDGGFSPEETPVVSDTVTPPSPIPSAPADRAQFWRDTLAAFATSGLTVREFCRLRGLHEKRFYTWRRDLGLSPVVRPATAPSDPPAARGFVPVRVVSDPVAEVALPGGVTVRVPLSSDPAHVARLVAAVRGATC
jgi:hypothetical protein